jgi:hypothetical protein
MIDDPIGCEETRAKIGGAIDNCLYINHLTVEVLFELACQEAQRLGVNEERMVAWTKTYARQAVAK